MSGRAEHGANSLWRVSTTTDLSSLETDWRALEATGRLTPYQRFDWIAAWCREAAPARGISPWFVVIEDGFGAAAIYPLGVMQTLGGRCAFWLGDEHANYREGLLRPGVVIDGETIKKLLVEAARRDGIDAFVLGSIPSVWNETPSPFASLPHQQGPVSGYGSRLVPDGTTFLDQRISSSSRSKLGRKRRNLEKLGALRVVRARDAQTAHAILDAFFAQKAERLTAKGIPNVFARKDVASFIREAATAGFESGHQPALALYALYVGEEIFATFAGAVDRSRFSGMFNSIAINDFMRYSPGEILLQEIVKASCEDGLSYFDLGAGDAAYKGTLCDDEIPLIDVAFGATARGHVAAMAWRRLRAIKRAIKHNPHIWSRIEALRAFKGRMSQRR